MERGREREGRGKGEWKGEWKREGRGSEGEAKEKGKGKGKEKGEEGGLPGQGGDKPGLPTTAWMLANVRYRYVPTWYLTTRPTKSALQVSMCSVGGKLFSIPCLKYSYSCG